MTVCGAESVRYDAPPQYIEKLASPFAGLTLEEKKSEWGKELLIGKELGKEEDLFRAVTALKRAKILLKHEGEGRGKGEGKSEGYDSRYAEIEYDLFLSYWLARKFNDVTSLFEKGNLKVSPHNFRAYNEMLVVLYDSYMQQKDQAKAEKIFRLIEARSGVLAKKIVLYKDFEAVNVESLPADFQTTYHNNKKSPFRAGLYNALLPGAGYMYVGQIQTGVTSFLLNALFCVAAYEFFHHKQYAAGIITSGFEMGWYAGGIVGARLAAETYNAALYKRLAYDTMTKEKLFPVLMLEYGF